MRNTRTRQIYAVATLVQGTVPHGGGYGRWGYAPSKKRQVKKAFLRARRRGVAVRRAMTDASLEIGRYA